MSQQTLQYIPTESENAIQYQLRQNLESHEIIYMSPKRFLEVCLPGKNCFKWRGWNFRNRDYLKNLLINNKPIDMPYLRVDHATGKVLGHEGRHRSLTAYELGIEKIPVTLIHMTGLEYHTLIPSPLKPTKAAQIILGLAEQENQE